MIKNLVHHHRHAVHVLRADLHEDAAALAQQLPRMHEIAVEVVEVGVDAVLVGVAEGLDLLRVAGQALGVFGHVAALRVDLHVRLEADPVGRVHVDHLDLAGHPLLLEQAGHHLDRIAVDQPVLPVALVLVPLVLGIARQVVEIAEHRRRRQRAQLLHERRRVYFLRDVERRRVRLDPVQVRPAVPREHRPRALADRRRIAHRLAVLVLHELAGLLGRQVPPPLRLVPVGIHPLSHRDAPLSERIG